MTFFLFLGDNVQENDENCSIIWTINLFSEITVVTNWDWSIDAPRLDVLTYTTIPLKLLA